MPQCSYLAFIPRVGISWEWIIQKVHNRLIRRETLEMGVVNIGLAANDIHSLTLWKGTSDILLKRITLVNLA